MSLSSKTKSTYFQEVENSGVQKTLKQEVGVSGAGLFSGHSVNVKIKPAPENHGIVFVRTDVPGSQAVPAILSSVVATPRCTVIGKNGVVIQTVEHLLAALSALEIDNAIIEIDGPEVPVLDGSSQPFVDVLQKVGFTLQKEPKVVYKLIEPIYYSDKEKDIQIVAIPSDKFRISYTLQFPAIYSIATQFASFAIDPKVFAEEISPARTFSAYEEIAPLIEKGLIRGGSLQNAVLIQEGKVLNPEGVRMGDEFVRHKILDMIGDLSLINFSFIAHIISIRSGHSSNHAFAKLLENKLTTEIS